MESTGCMGDRVGPSKPNSSKKKGRSESPSYGIIDAQSVKTQYASHDRGFDGHKKVKGRKRHGVVDILGNLVIIVVHSASRSDTLVGCHVLAKASQKYKTIKAFSGDQGDRGTAVAFVKNELGLSLTISAKKEGGFTVLGSSAPSVRNFTVAYLTQNCPLK